MRRSAMWTALFLSLAGQARSGPLDCALADQIFSMRMIYYAMIGRPGSTAVIASVSKLEAFLAPAAARTPELAPRIELMAALGREILDAGGGLEIGQADRARHFSNAAAFAVPSSAECDARRRTPEAVSLSDAERDVLDAAAAEIGAAPAPPETWELPRVTVDGADVGAAVQALALWTVRLMGAGLAAGLIWLGLRAALAPVRTAIERRRLERLPYRGPVWIAPEGGLEVAAVAVDVSRSGIKLATAAGLPRGTKVEVTLGGEGVPGRICWSNAHFAGVEFDTLMAKQRFADLLAAAPEPADAPGPAATPAPA